VLETAVARRVCRDELFPCRSRVACSSFRGGTFEVRAFHDQVVGYGRVLLPFLRG
jgi:uncharacterized protein (DUF885 family)